MLLASAACRTERQQTPAHAITIDSLAILDLGESTLSEPVGATQLPDGSIAVADRGEYAVRFFVPSGRLLSSTGRLGQCAHDSVFVWDRMTQRMTVLGPDRHVAREFQLRPVPTAITCSRSGAVAYFGPPEAVPTSVAQMATAEFRGQLYAMVSVADTVHALGVYPMGQARPLGRITALAVAGDRLIVGTADSDTILVLDFAGKAGAPLTTRVAVRQPNARQFDRATALQSAVFRNAATRAMSEQMLHRLPMPEHLPAYQAVLADTDGIIWVQLSIPGDSVTWLRGLTLDNVIIGDLRIAGEVQVFEIGHDHLIGAIQAADGSIHVVKLRVRRL